jgi:hypothetical protein
MSFSENFPTASLKAPPVNWRERNGQNTMSFQPSRPDAIAPHGKLSFIF